MTPTRTTLARLPVLLLLSAPLVCGAAVAAAGASSRTIITVLTAGKEVASLTFPVGQKVELSMHARQIAEDAGTATVHASGNVQLTLQGPGLAPATLLGDDILIRTERIDAARAQAIADLLAMGASDQLLRGQNMTGPMSAADQQRQTRIDQANMARLATIIATWGWPGARFAGAVAANNAFLVLQHSSVGEQQRYLPLLRAAAGSNDAAADEVALLEDRVRVASGRPQWYGSQLTPDGKQLYPVEHESGLDARRAAVGLMPIASYLALFGLHYTAPATR